MQEYRHTTRLDISLPCLVDHNNKTLSADTRNLSLGGTCVSIREQKKEIQPNKAKEEFTVGEEVRCQFLLNSLNFSLQGKVIRTSQQSAAIVFGPIITTHAFYLMAIMAQNKQG